MEDNTRQQIPRVFTRPRERSANVAMVEAVDDEAFGNTDNNNKNDDGSRSHSYSDDEPEPRYEIDPSDSASRSGYIPIIQRPHDRDQPRQVTVIDSADRQGHPIPRAKRIASLSGAAARVPQDGVETNRASRRLTEPQQQRFRASPVYNEESDHYGYDSGYGHGRSYGPSPQGRALRGGTGHRTHAVRRHYSLAPQIAQPVPPVPYSNPHGNYYSPSGSAIMPYGPTNGPRRSAASPMPVGYSGGRYFGHPQQYLYSNPPLPPATPAPRSRADLELERLKADMAKHEAELRVKEDERQRREFEERVRRDAEETTKRTIEAVQRAQEEVRKEIETAKHEAELAAREHFEAGLLAEEERRKILAEERAKVKAALEAHEIARKQREEAEVRMLKEAKERAILELEAERERTRRDEAERAKLLEELRLQVREDMAAEAKKKAEQSAEPDTSSRPEFPPAGQRPPLPLPGWRLGMMPPGVPVGRKRSSGRGRPEHPKASPTPPMAQHAPTPALARTNGDGDGMIEERVIVDSSDDSERSSHYPSEDSETWNRREARRTRKARREERRELLVIKELVNPIIEALVGRLPLQGGPQMQPMPAFYMQHPPPPKVTERRRRRRDWWDDNVHPWYLSDEDDGSESDADAITPRRPRRQSRSRSNNGNSRRRRRRRRSKSRQSREESDSRFKEEMREVDTVHHQRPSLHPRKSRVPEIEGREVQESQTESMPVSALKSQSTTGEIVRGPETPDPSPSSSQNEGERLADTAADDEPSEANSRASNKTARYSPVADTPEPSEIAPDIVVLEQIEDDLSDTTSVTVKPDAESTASTQPKVTHRITAMDAPERGDAATKEKDRVHMREVRSRSRRSDSNDSFSPQGRRRVGRREEAARPVREQDQERGRDRDRGWDELDIYSQSGLAPMNRDIGQIWMPFPYQYSNQFGTPAPSFAVPEVPGSTHQSYDSGRRGDDRRRPTIPVAFIPQPYAFIAMPSFHPPMLRPPLARARQRSGRRRDGSKSTDDSGLE